VLKWDSTVVEYCSPKERRGGKWRKAEQERFTVAGDRVVMERRSLAAGKGVRRSGECDRREETNGGGENAGESGSCNLQGSAPRSSALIRAVPTRAYCILRHQRAGRRLER
jgi:hypothetical protein